MKLIGLNKHVYKTAKQNGKIKSWNELHSVQQHKLQNHQRFSPSWDVHLSPTAYMKKLSLTTGTCSLCN